MGLKDHLDHKALQAYRQLPQVVRLERVVQMKVPKKKERLQFLFSM